MYAMSFQRQPLGPCNGQKTSRLPMPGSKLPMPGSRLPMPGSKLKPPTTMKRGRSPEPVSTLQLMFQPVRMSKDIKNKSKFTFNLENLTIYIKLYAGYIYSTVES